MYLVCDGGGTKTDFLLFEKTGRVRGRAQGAGANANFVPPAEAAHTVYAGVMEVLGKAGLRAGDTILISSNTGINTVPVEAALYAKERGLTVVCVTSKKISRTLASRAPEGKRLYEVSDIVIDNHAPRGDGLLTIPGTQQITGGASTFGSLFIAQRIVLKIENLYLAQGRMPPVLCSANLPGGDEYNTSAVAAYQGRIKALC